MEQLALIAGVFGASVASGFIPLINVELVVIGAAAATAGPMVAAVVIAASVGQMIAKVVMYLGAARAAEVPTGRLKAKLDRYRHKVERHAEAPGMLTFVSSLVGLPPLYIVSLLAGALRMPLGVFAIAGLAGRLLRLGALAALPDLLSGWP